MITLSSQPSKSHQTQKASKRRPSSRGHQKPRINSGSKINPTFEKVRKQLRALSNKKLLNDLEGLNRRERKLKVLALLFLSEIDKRELYLPMGYSSLFEFCTGHLGYARATAARRIRAARAAAMYPETLDMLRSGEINITTLSMISEILDLDNHEEIFSEVKGKSTRYVELLVSRHKPVHVIRDTVRPVCVVRRLQESEVALGTSDGTDLSSSRAEAKPGIQNAPVDNGRPAGDSGSSAEIRSGNRGGQLCDDPINNNSESSLSAETKLSASGHPEKIILEQRLKLGFSVSPEFMAKYNKIKSLLSGRHPEGINFETLFDITMTEYLLKHDPEKRRERREKKARKPKKSVKEDTSTRRTRRPEQSAKSVKPVKCASRSKRAGRARSAGNGEDVLTINSRKKSRDSRSNSRRIPPAVRDRVYTRDRGRCTFIGANGKRCNSTWDLEIDHIVPYARGGDNSPGNLRLLCRKHNNHEAEKTYGKKFMQNRLIK